MPKQINGVEISQNPDGETYNVQIGPYGFEGLPAGQIWNRNEDEQQIKDNLRLSKKISGFMLGSRELLDSVNKSGAGAQAASGKYFIKEVKLVDADSETYEIGWGPKAGEVTYTMQCSRAELESDPQNVETVLRNLPAWMRAEGITSWAGMTAAKKAKLRAWQFWI